jgi:hypothetical protein
MNPKHAFKIVFAAALGALAIFVLPGLASARDGNDDGIPDRWEKHHHLSLEVDQSGRDQDRDHLRNRAEFRAGNDPRDHDSDDDGVMDGEENAGTIESFDKASGRLVLDLFGAATVSGVVTDRTEIKCEGERSADDSVLRREAGDDSSGSGDSSGPGSGSEDNSGPGSGDSGRRGHDGDDDDGGLGSCTAAHLVPGAVVEEAELEIEHGRASYEEIELAHTN